MPYSLTMIPEPVITDNALRLPNGEWPAIKGNVSRHQDAAVWQFRWEGSGNYLWTVTMLPT